MKEREDLAGHLFKYLALTTNRGIYYWRQHPNSQLPDIPSEPCIAPVDNLTAMNLTPQQVQSFVDSDWGSDRVHRRSVTGMTHQLAGGTIAYKSKFQTTIALSSTEAEFTAAADAGKTILYLRSILTELGYPQLQPTTLFEDNAGAFYMATAERPTRRTRHMDTKTFAIQDWIRQDYLEMKPIRTNANISDHFTKALGRVKFYEQTDVIMGRRRPIFPTNNGF